MKGTDLVTYSTQTMPEQDHDLQGLLLREEARGYRRDVGADLSDATHGHLGVWPLMPFLQI